MTRMICEASYGNSPKKLLLTSLVSALARGSAGSANGTMRLTSGRSCGICHGFELSVAAGARIQRVTSNEIRRWPVAA